MNAGGNDKRGHTGNHGLATPFLLIQEKRLERNIRRIHDYANRHGFTLRPHVKTHKSLHIAHKQMNACARGIAVARAGEAAVMARLGHLDEIRVGTALLNDYFVLKFGHCQLEDCAACVVATVAPDVVPGKSVMMDF